MTVTNIRSGSAKVIVQDASSHFPWRLPTISALPHEDYQPKGAMHAYALVQLAWITDVDRRGRYFGGGLFCRVGRVRVVMGYLNRLCDRRGRTISLAQFST